MLSAVLICWGRRIALFLRLCGLGLLVLVAVQVAATLWTVTFDTDPMQMLELWVFAVPSRSVVHNSLFYFDLIMGSLLWIFETGIAIVLMSIGGRMGRADRRAREEEQEAISRVLAARKVDQRP